MATWEPVGSDSMPVPEHGRDWTYQQKQGIQILLTLFLVNGDGNAWERSGKAVAIFVVTGELDLLGQSI